MQHLRLTRPDLDLWIDVRLRGWDGRWLAVTDLAGEPGVGTGTGPRDPSRDALTALGEPYSRDMAGDAELEGWSDER